VSRGDNSAWEGSREEDNLGREEWQGRKDGVTRRYVGKTEVAGGRSWVSRGRELGCGKGVVSRMAAATQQETEIKQIRI
jgi:hypothetical protein